VILSQGAVFQSRLCARLPRAAASRSSKRICFSRLFLIPKEKKSTKFIGIRCRNYVTLSKECRLPHFQSGPCFTVPLPLPRKERMNTRERPPEDRINSDKTRVLSDQVRQLYVNAPLGMAATLVNASALAYILRGTVSHQTLFLWLACQCILILLRAVHVYSYRRSPWKPADARAQAASFIGGMFLSGVVWGSAGIFLFPEGSIVHQVFLAFVLGGMVAGAAGTFSIVREAFLAFSIPALLPLLLRFSLIGDELHVTMGGMILLYIVLIHVVAMRVHTVSVRSLTLRHENFDLVSFLTEARKRAETLNEELRSEINERKEAERELQDHRDHLEELVTERTVKLTLANVRLQEEMAARAAAEEDLLRVQKLESLGILAGGIAHDFNNLMTGITVNIALAKIRAERDRELADLLEKAEEAAVRTHGLTQQLLTFSRGGEPVKKTILLGDLIKESAGFALRGSKAGCAYSLPAGLRPVEADAGQLRQVIQNIVINADQAMPQGGSIGITAENALLRAREVEPLAAGEYVKIAIADQGVGIPREQVAKIFDPYFTTKDKGSGLGLATAHSIVRKHGGAITVASEPGSGTTISVYLPVSRHELEAPRTMSGGLVSGAGRVLVMDDEEILRDVAEKVLQAVGYEVVTAKDGNEAVELYNAARKAGKPFDVVIMDLTVPGGAGGKDAVRKLLEFDPGAKAVVSSGYSHDPVMAHYSDYGFLGVITKPYNIREMTETVARVIAMKR
jgi:signal transduction histidine kinase/CheY-like chemotaxis protein